MKKSITFLAIFIATTLFAQTTYVPDDNFETYLETHDANGNSVAMGDATSMGNGVMDDYVPTAKISGVTTLNVSNKNIGNLTGIQNFTALTTLLCISNNLQNINVTQNTALTTLNCASNSLSNIDVSNNIALTILNIGDNYFTGIDVSNNTLLQLLIVSTNQITDLDLSNNTSLTSLLCSSNLLTRLDVSQNAALSLLYCYSNLLTDLDISANTALTQLICNSNHLTNLNMQNGDNSNIFNNNFKAIDNPYLSCILVDDTAYSTANWHQIDTIASFNETACTQMTYVPDDNFETYLETHDADGNAVTMGDATSMGDGTMNDLVLTDNISGVTNLNVSSQSISDLTGIQDFTALTQLLCYNNNLQSIDVSQNTVLESLKCYVNHLATLDVSQNVALTYLNCSTNDLTVLDVSQNTALIALGCNHNILTTLNVKNGNNTNFISFDATNNPNLTCILVDDAAYSTTNWTNIDTTSTFVNNQAECDALSVAENSFETQINLYPNPVKESFTIINKSSFSIEQISIYNVLGKLVYNTNENSTSIPTSSLVNGVYFVKLKSKNKSITKKIIVSN